MDETLTGKVALVTGGAKRVGAAICRRLHARGANIMLHHRASVNEAPMGTSLLGMSFLSRLSSWRVEGDRLTLTR